MKLSNYRDRDAFSCEWRPCQQALPYLLPALTRRALHTTDEALFAAVLRDRNLPIGDLISLGAAGSLGGLASCRDADGELEAGGAVLSLRSPVGAQVAAVGDAAPSREAMESAGAEASVVVVLSPGGLAVWAPKEEVRGLLELLEAPFDE